MKISIKLLLPFGALLILAATTFGQRQDGHGAHSGPPNLVVVIISSAAKGTWAVTAFTASTIAKPVAKTLLLKATPAVSKFVLKHAAKEALPLLVKLSVL